MNEDKDIIFCFDSSALIDLHKYYGKQRIPEMWDELEDLFARGKIISHKIVFDELTTQAKKPSELSSWVSSKSSSFRDMTGTQAKYVESIVNQFPRLIDPLCEKDQADPWLVALILEERYRPSLFQKQEIVMVSQESITSDHKIPAACDFYHIRHFSLFDFFDYNGWKLKFEKA